MNDQRNDQSNDDQSDARDPAKRASLTEILRTCVKGFVLEPASKIAAAEVEWLWPGRIPLGHLTLLAGDPDVGKSMVALDLAARVSSGAPWPDNPAKPVESTDRRRFGRRRRRKRLAAARKPLSSPTVAALPDPPREPANVLMLTTHDNPAATLRPRLERAGANLDRVVFANGIPRAPDSNGLSCQRPIRFPDDNLSLTRALVELAPVKLVILDPAWAFCSRGGRRSRLAGPAQLAELVQLAALLHVAIVCVTDLRRTSRGSGVYEVAGNRALTAAARVGWGVVRHPKDRDKRLLLPLKMNLGPPGTGLEFAIDEGGLTWEDEPATVTAEAVFAAEKSGTEQEVAEHWLRTFLADGSRPAKEIMAQATECGLSVATLRRAKAALGVKVQRVDFSAGKAHWNWSLADGSTENRSPEIGSSENGAAADENQIARIYATA